MPARLHQILYDAGRTEHNPPPCVTVSTPDLHLRRNAGVLGLVAGVTIENPPMGLIRPRAAARVVLDDPSLQRFQH